MILIFFILIYLCVWLPFFLRSLRKSDDYDDKNSYIYGGRKSVSNSQLEDMRKKLSCKKSKF